MFNLFSALFAIIAAPAVEAPALDDTQEIKPLVLHTRAITAADILLGTAGLLGCLVDYELDRDNHIWHLGHIQEARLTLRGLELFIVPNATNGHRFLSCWRIVSMDSVVDSDLVEMAWYDVETE